MLFYLPSQLIIYLYVIFCVNKYKNPYIVGGGGLYKKVEPKRGVNIFCSVRPWLHHMTR